MNNVRLRKAITDTGLKHWEVADAVGVCHYTFSVWLRHELSDARRIRVEAAIERLRKERVAECIN